jgi:hypothetical protein
MIKHTPGPWRWEVNMAQKTIQLCGGKPQYDLTIMDFSRWGMNGARPRVLDHADHMLLREAEDYRVIVPGREHHASWFQGIDHPDMNLIAAAPELLEKLKEAVEFIEGIGSPVRCTIDFRAAIAKAEGSNPYPPNEKQEPQT